MANMKMRLALRREGEWWNAYLAQMDTMDGARKIGSILLGAVENNEERKRAFMDLMKDVMTEAIKEITGKLPDWWEEQEAPEHEKAGRA